MNPEQDMSPEIESGLATADLAAAGRHGAADEDARIEDSTPEDIRAGEERPAEERSFDEPDAPLRKHDGAGLTADSARLIPQEEAAKLHEQWDRIQGHFVDEPRSSVQEADQLAAQAITRLADSFAGERARMESQWSRGDDVSTEELRQTLRKYRALFERLLAV